MLKIAHITDLHLGAPGQQYLGLSLRGRFLKVLANAREQQPDFFVFGGDYSLNRPDRAACEWLKEELDKLDQPYYLLSGNHDRSEILADVFGLSLAEGKLRYTFNQGGVDHVFLDSSLGHVEKEQLDWLRETLAKSQRSVIWMHHPPQLMGAPFMDSKHSLRNRGQLLEVLFDHQKPLRVLCGHYHAALQLNQRNLQIHVAPPTSFFINASSDNFQQEHYSAGYQMLLLGANHRSLVTPIYVR